MYSIINCSLERVGIKIAVVAISVTVIFSLRFLVSIDKIYQTLEAVFCHISEHLTVGQKYSAVRLVFNSLLDLWKCVGTRSLKFNILHKTVQTHLSAQTFNVGQKFNLNQNLSPLRVLTGL